MNCKQGDLAVFVRSVAGNEGKIVRCVELSEHKGTYGPSGFRPGAVWLIDAMVTTWAGDKNRFARDDALRPIRPQPDDAQDETLTWLDVPSEVTA